ncbi:MAG: phosphopantothenoylcysteine decarboxylase [Bacillota bacterium]|nr:phosphopantothenoylcysteine decarboxylase [Bacillota bacterium]
MRRPHLIVTGGPTEAPLDEVRFLSNRSSGRTAAAVAGAALARGWDVTFVHGPGSALPQGGEGWLRRVAVRTVGDLAAALERLLRDPERPVDALVHAMAVLDFAPDRSMEGKVSSRGEWWVRLVPTPKVVEQIRRWAPGIFLVAFKLEAGEEPEELVRAAREAAARHGADLVVANSLRQVGADRHVTYLVDPHGGEVRRSETNAELAALLLERIEARLAPRREPVESCGRPGGGRG